MVGLSRDHVRNMENQGFSGSESSQLNLIKLTYSPSCCPTIDLFLYCIEVRVHDSGHSKSNIDITIFRDHEPIRVEHTVTRCEALVLVLITCEARDSAWIYIAWTYKLISVNIGL